MKVFVFVMGLIGPQNACIGMAQALQEHGHEIHFLVSNQTKDRFSAYGFKHHPLEDVANQEKAESFSTSVCKEFNEIGFFTDLSSYEKFKLFSKIDFLEDLYKGCHKFNTQCLSLMELEKPDVIMVDSKIVPPCLIAGHIPFVSIFCANPLSLFDSPKLPPYTSGFASNENDPEKWANYTQLLNEIYYGMNAKYQNRLNEETKTTLAKPVKMTRGPVSPYLNVYQYPEELDYHDLIDIPDNCVRVDAFCRKELETFELPQHFQDGIEEGRKLIYLSLGTIGSYAIEVMRKLVEILAHTPHLYIVSKGQLANEYELAENMIGGTYLPQTSILPLVDLVITHGGNNSVTESIYNGKPLIVMPMFYDQFDNAQRVEEKRFGIRLNPFNLKAEDLVPSIDKLLSDNELLERLKKASARIQQSQSKANACKRIEEMVADFHKH